MYSSNTAAGARLFRACARSCRGPQRSGDDGSRRVVGGWFVGREQE